MSYTALLAKCGLRRVIKNSDELVDVTFELFNRWYKSQTVAQSDTQATANWINGIRPDLISVITELNEAMVETATMPHDDYDSCMILYNRAVEEINKGDTSALVWIMNHRSTLNPL
jgi:hypothetical protein